MSGQSAGGQTASLFSRLLLWLEGELDAGHYKKLVTWPWAVFVALGGLGVIASFNDPTISRLLIALGIVLFMAYWALIALGVTVRSRQRKVKHDEDMAELTRDLNSVTDRADKYAAVIVDSQNSDPDRFRIRSWTETHHVYAGGRAVIVRDLVLESGEKPLTVVSSTLQSDNPLADKNSVKFEAFLLTDQGDTGMSIPSTHAWMDSSDAGEQPYMRVFLHYADHIAPRSTVQVRMRWEWPGYYRMFTEGEPERWYIRFRRSCDDLKYRLNLAPDCIIQASLKTHLIDSTPPLTLVPQPDGSLDVSFEVANAAPGSKYGFRFEGIPKT